MTINENERHVLVHTLTGSSVDGAAYRNYFLAGPGHVDEPALNRLCDIGLMRRGHTINNGADRYYHCTAKGAEAVGLHLPDNT